MAEKVKGKKSGAGSLPKPSFSDLRGKQSVRATFKLTGRAIEAIKIMSVHLGIKQKSLFDHLLDDSECLSLIAQEVQTEEFCKLKRIQKTFVVSRKTISCLEAASKNFSAPRDALVEYSIKRLQSAISEEREKHRKRKKVMDEVTDFLRQGEEILRKARKSLGEKDPLYEKFEAALTVSRDAHRSIESIIEKGEILETL